MTNTSQNWEESLSRLDIADEEERGCTVSLGEFLHPENLEVIKDFIKDQRKQACREMIEYMKKEFPHIIVPGPGDLLTTPVDNPAIQAAEEFLKKML